jgi:hypothetical protein
MRLMRVLVRVYCSVGVRVFVGVRVPMLIGVRVRMLIRMFVRVRMFVLMILNRVLVIVPVLVLVLMEVLPFYEDVDLGTAEPPAHHLTALETRTHVQGCHGVLKHGEGDTGIHEGAEKHVAGDTGKAFEISNSHQGNCKRDSGIAAGVG